MKKRGRKAAENRNKNTHTKEGEKRDKKCAKQRSWGKEGKKRQKRGDKEGRK